MESDRTGIFAVGGGKRPDRRHAFLLDFLAEDGAGVHTAENLYGVKPPKANGIRRASKP